MKSIFVSYVPNKTYWFDSLKYFASLRTASLRTASMPTPKGRAQTIFLD